MKKRPRVCRLCGHNTYTTRHHLIPKSVLYKINRKSDLSNLTIFLCVDCHKEVHNSFIEHLIMNGKIDGFNKFHAIKYQVIKNYMRKKHENAWKDFNKYWKEFLNHELEKMNEVKDNEQAEDNNIL